MLLPRIIPCLLLRGGGFYKTTKFKKPIYLGDPINILKIFNEKKVDEIMVLDIGATASAQGPNFSLLRDFASECFMPLSYGGGINRLDQIKALFQLGLEKVCLNTAAAMQPGLVTEAARIFGSQSIVVSIDARRKLLGGYETAIRNGSKTTGRSPTAFAAEMERRGAGEILITSVDRDGAMEGYDLNLVGAVSRAVGIPVIACGGAGGLEDFHLAIHQAGASAAAAGSFFVFQSKKRGVLISYPHPEEIIGLAELKSEK